jgi:molecular chaperone DnaK (HSP70)
MLTSSVSTELLIPLALGIQNIELKITRSDFERCLNGEAGNKIDYLEKIKDKLNRLFQESNITSKGITSVLLTGGSSQIPIIKELLQQYFSLEKIKHIPSVHLAVGRGASAYAAYILDKKDDGSDKRLSQWGNIDIKEVQSHNLGVKTARGFQIMLKANTVTPNSRVIQFEPTSLSEDGSKANVNEIIVLQGERNKHVPIGTIKIGDIYTHGRVKEDITIIIKFIAESTDVKVEVKVPKGNSDQSDILIKESIQLSES